VIQDQAWRAYDISTVQVLAYKILMKKMRLKTLAMISDMSQKNIQHPSGVAKLKA
jgi:hypothetical protein